jgi:hypothetical protein
VSNLPRVTGGNSPVATFCHPLIPPMLRQFEEEWSLHPCERGDSEERKHEWTESRS